MSNPQTQTNTRTHYEVLGVPQNADAKTIRQAYLRASLNFHPDKNPGNEEYAKAQFIQVGEAYEVLRDSTKRAAYDRELASGAARTRGTYYTASSSPYSSTSRQKASANRETDHRTTNASGTREGGSHAGNATRQHYRNQHPNAQTTESATFSSNKDSSYSSSSTRSQRDRDFENFMHMFDETVSSLSEEELNMAMGAASVVGSVIGSIIGARVTKSRGGGGNSVIASAASMVGSAVASQAASTLVKSVHEDSRLRVLEREEREARIRRGEAVEEPRVDERERIIKDVFGTVRRVAEAAIMGGCGGGGCGEGGISGSSSLDGNEYDHDRGNSGNSNNRGGLSWGHAVKFAGMAANVVAELQRQNQNS
ncbi:hypothetical protein ACHAXS_002997 [Conticribra weissflogii]